MIIHCTSLSGTLSISMKISNKLIPEETFFIDDTQENTIMANKLGIICWNLNPNSEDVVNLLSKKEFN